MKNPARMLSLALFGLFLAAATLPTLAQAERAEKAQPPNIILIFCDDLGYGDIGVHWQDQRAKAGKPAFDTPHIDAMARAGVQMRHTYCPAPVCAPSRSSLLLGVTQGHANVRNNQFDKALEDNHTLGSVMQAAGYATAAIGKWGLQGKPGDDTPNKFEAHPMNRGFDYYFGYIRHRDGHMHYPKEDKKECYDGATNIADQLDLCFTPDLFTARAKKWIVDHNKAKPDQPFFVYLAHDTPHAILQNPPSAYPKRGGLTGGVQWLGEPGRMINTAKGKKDAWMHPDYAKTDWPDVNKRYANLVRRIDDTVGDLNQLLVDLGIEDNTLVIFTSDNGPSRESYLKDNPFSPAFFEGFGPFDGIKRDLWEGGIRPGMIAKWNGTIPAGRINNEPSTFADFMATFCDAANAPVPAKSDGVSMLPSMTGRGKQQPANVYIEYQNNGRTPNYDAFDKAHQGRKRGQMQAIRLGDYIGVRYDIRSHADDFEIYKIAEDPGQENNLANQPGMAKLQQQMKDEVLRRRVVNDSAKRPYDDEPIPAVQIEETKPGLRVFIADRADDSVVNVQAGHHGSVGTAKTVDYAEKVEHPATMLYRGYLAVPATGTYTLKLETNQRSLLRLHDAALIDNDRPFSNDRKTSATVKLEKGLHPIRVYVNGSDQDICKIKLVWSGPGIEGEQTIPSEAFGH